jgi:hypothetical protein
MDDHAISLMRRLIEQFIERQQLVALAMLDIHPGPLQMAGTHILGIEIAPHIGRWRQRQETEEGFHYNWQKGIWRGEWEHWAHGIGCRLTNIHTGERIEWDAPDLQAFDEHWFWNYLDWRVRQTTPTTMIEERMKWLGEIYQSMRDTEIIVKNEHFKFILK